MKYLLLILSMTTLAACQSTHELQNASADGLPNSYSCGQNNGAFSAYEADKNSFMALKKLQ